MYTPKSKKVAIALFDLHLLFHVWSFITPGEFWGKIIVCAVYAMVVVDSSMLSRHTPKI